MKFIIVLGSVLILAACATAPVMLTPSSGSGSDAINESYFLSDIGMREMLVGKWSGIIRYCGWQFA